MRHAHCALIAIACLLTVPVQAAKPTPQAIRALELNNTAALKLAGLEREFAQIKLAPVFTAAALTSPARVAEGRATIARLRALTAQRAEVSRRHAADIGALRKTAPGALSGIDSYLEQSQRVHDELHAARSEVADQADAVLAWATEQGATIRVENNRMRMSTPEQQQRFDALFARLDSAMARHDKAVDASDAFRKANQGRMNTQPIPPQGKPTR